MATSSCPKCGLHSFELQESSPSKSAYKFMYVQCSSCGTVVGVMDWFNIGAMILKQNKAIAAIARQVNVHVDLD